MELSETEPIGPLDQHDGRVRHVDADLDDGGRDENVELVIAEETHHVVLLRRTHPSVQETNPEVWEDISGEPLVLGKRSPRVDALRLFDERTDDERLTAFRNLATNELVGLQPLVWLEHLGLNLLAAWR